MIPLKLYIKNFLSYGSDVQEINFEPYKVIFLVGKNGHGKSALLEAITWSIWGQARKDQSCIKPDDGLIKIGANYMSVEIDLKVGSNIYKIKREFLKRNLKGQSLLNLYILEDVDTYGTGNQSFINITEKTIQMTQQKINSILMLTYESFINSCFIRQGQSNEFSKKNAKERKQILCSILNIDYFENLRKKALEKIRYLTIERDIKEKNISSSRIDIDLKKEIQENINNIKNDFKSLEIKLTDLNLLRKDLYNDGINFKNILLVYEPKRIEKQNLLIDLDNTNKNINLIKDNISSIDFNALNNNINKLKIYYEKNILFFKLWKERYINLDLKVKNNLKKMKLLVDNNSKCYFCMQDINQDYKDKIQKNLEYKNNIYNYQLLRLKNLLKNLDVNIHNLLLDIKNHEMVYKNYLNNVERLEQLNKNIDQIKRKIYFINEDINKIEFENNIILDDIFEIMKMKDENIKKIDNQINNLLNEKNKKIYLLAKLEEKLNNIIKKEELLNNLSLELKKLDNDIHHYNLIAQGLSKDGIQALLIEDIIPEIENEANDILYTLSDNYIYLTIESLKDLKSGKVKETLDIKITDENGTRLYEMFSGGEAFKIDFALRIAISKILTKRSGLNLNTLIIDEGFSSQDEDGLINIVNAINRISNYFSKIIIVSHLDIIKEQMAVQFIITKEKGGTKVRVMQ